MKDRIRYHKKSVITLEGQLMIQCPIHAFLFLLLLPFTLGNGIRWARKKYATAESWRSFFVLRFHFRIFPDFFPISFQFLSNTLLLLLLPGQHLQSIELCFLSLAMLAFSLCPCCAVISRILHRPTSRPLTFYSPQNPLFSQCHPCGPIMAFSCPVCVLVFLLLHVLSQPVASATRCILSWLFLYWGFVSRKLQCRNGKEWRP